MFFRFIGVTTLAIASVGCTFVPRASGDLNASVILPTNVGLLGTVTNQNGIRDDVNAKLIAKYSATPAVLNAAIILARVEQDAMRMMETGIAPDQAYFTRMNYAIECIGIATPSGTSLVATTKEVEALTYNTPERLRAYMEFNKKLDGFRLYAPDVPDPCEAAK